MSSAVSDQTHWSDCVNRPPHPNVLQLGNSLNKITKIGYWKILQSTQESIRFHRSQSACRPNWPLPTTKGSICKPQATHPEVTPKANVCPTLCIGPLTIWDRPMKAMKSQTGPDKATLAWMSRSCRTTVLGSPNTGLETTLDSHWATGWALNQQHP